MRWSESATLAQNMILLMIIIGERQIIFTRRQDRKIFLKETLLLLWLEQQNLLPTILLFHGQYKQGF